MTHSDEVVLASATQHGMWVGEQLGAGPAYRMPLALWLDGDLDVAALREACDDVIDRHPVLSTTVAPAGPELRLAPAARPPVTVTHVSGPDAADQLIRDETQAGFDLRTGPLARFTIAAAGRGDGDADGVPRRHLLLVVAHHLVFDGMSTHILVRDLARFYAARVTAPGAEVAAEALPPEALPPEALSFPAAVAAERARAAAARPAARQFWARRWSEPSPTVFPGPLRPAGQFGAGIGIDAGIDPELGRDVTQAARAVGATAFEVLVAATHALLFRYGAQAPAVAIDMTTRPPAARDHIGPFVNEVPVLSRPAPGDSFRDFTLAIRADLRELYKFREVPFAEATAGIKGAAGVTQAAGVTEIQPSRGAPAAVSISYRRREPDPVFPGLRLTVDWMMFGGVRRPLHMHFVHGPEGLEMTIRVNPAALDRDTALRFADGLRAVARSAAADPGTRLAALDIMPAAERQRMVAGWNDTAAAYPAAATLPAMFARQARATPGAVAVTSGGRSLTYAELDAAATRMARRLQRAGVRRGDLVAVHLRRSDTLLACLLAVHRAGAAYLPLDPDHPAERLAMIAADAQPRLLLTETASPAAPRVPVLFAGEAGPGAGDGTPPDAGPPAEAAPVEALPGEVAYVIYTSGSTGQPKGVEVEHRNLANLLLGMRDRLGAGPAGTWLALTSPAFDISALELYLPLIAGGRVVIAPDGAPRRPQALAELVAREGVTHVQATPSVWRLLLPGGIAGVTALAGGEALPADLAEELRARCGRVFNVYGPTETTIWSTCAELAGPGAVTIGRPIANTQVYLIDASMRPVPVGVTGELCIGGSGVARGYRGLPGRTAGQFAPDPFGPAGARLYRTGDLARYRADGQIEFLGRRDGQVKLLGHRIELGEIETRLREQPGVGEAAVIVRGADSGDARLVAYIVPDGVSPGAAPDPGDLTARLAAVLPAAMLPSAYVTLDALPLNPVGKLDRAALPDAPDRIAHHPGHFPITGPGTSSDPNLAAEVLRIWREVLDLGDATEIGVDDDLFDLGGHSLLITQITARVKDRIGVDVSLDAVFDDPTIGGMVAEITRLRSAHSVGPRPGETEYDDWADERPAVLPRPAGVSPPLSFAQERLWFLQRFDPDDASYNTYLVLRLRGRLDGGTLAATLDAVVARHESLRTSFADVDGEPAAVIHPPGPFPVEHIDLAAGDDAEQRARHLVAERVNAPFDLAAAPPVRISLLALGPGDHVLCFVLHHIICDGWSHGVLFDDLFTIYQALGEGREPDLPALRVQYGDIARWQRQRDSGQAAEEALAYWRDRLADPPRLELPLDMPRGQRPAGAFHDFRVPEEVIAPLERLAQQHGASLFMVLVAAYQALLARHSGHGDVLVGTTWAARDQVEFEPVIGYLTDTLVLRGDLRGDPAFADLLDATRRRVLEAHAHRVVPFERLIGELGLPRDVDRNPLLSTMVIQHSQAGDGSVPERIGDLQVALFDSGYRQAKFDLTLETWREETGLLAVFGYDATLFHAATVERLADRFGALLRGIADAPATRVSRLPLLTPAELATVQLATVGPATAGPATAGPATAGASPGTPSGRAGGRDLVPALFSRAAAAAPAATALACGGEAVSYADLDARVTRVAAALRRRGVRPGDVVGVCLGRSADAVAALLAAWRAGAAYLPLDPDYPDERLAFMIADSGARLVVTSTGLAHRPPPGTDLVLVEAPPGDGDNDNANEGPWPPAGPGQPAYVIYTSGSTGQPKGVLVEHGALASRVHWMREAYGLAPADRVAQFASLSFDAHAEELYPALASGASVLLLPDGAATLPDELRRPAGRAVTVLDLPTAYWHRLTEALGDVTWPEPLRLVIIGGEQAHAAAVARWRDCFGDGVRLVNTYGPTEAVIIATARALDARDALRTPPIGRPIDGTVARVLGPHGELVPPGVPGELHLGGAGLARGYLDAALTAGRFVPDPHGPPGSRMYRTGDRVRLRADGELEFLGRFDDQLKVRGFRVEPGEVTTALLAHPGVRQAAVTADGERLVAYVAGTAGPDELRGHLAATLPAYLVPSAWVSLDELPLAVTGKVDVAALPAPAPVPAVRYVPPQTDAEVLVAGVWAVVLGLDEGKVGAADDFFALGGHSLLATRVAALLRNAIDVDVPIRTVFDAPTVAGLATAVESLLIQQLSGLSDAEAARLLEQEVPQ